ncbi:hypothetical protein D1007_05502 [Hordeum vulgare]|nr:hypothetical protein D1007_05502 [Hordeum vulgare]
MALKNLDDIPTWNWARYVVNDIISAARALANKLTDETKATYINGCVIFLQIFYLDNLELGTLNLKHDCFPRIMAYDQHAMNVRMNMDLKEKNQYKPTQFGMMKLRPRCDVCYSRPTIGMKSAFRAESGAGPSEINPNSKIVQQAFVKGHNLSDGNTGSCANVFHPNSHVQLQHSSGQSHMQFTTNIPGANNMHAKTSTSMRTPGSHGSLNLNRSDARQPRSGSPIERKAAKVYTDAMFAKFSDQVYMSASYLVQEITADGTYITVHMDCDTRENWSKLEFPVHVNKDEEEYRYKYIKKRWTCNAREGNKGNFDMVAAASRTHRHTLLFEACMDLSSKGDASVDAYHVAMRKVTEALQEILFFANPRRWHVYISSPHKVYTFG